jgi:hypothetical protein
MLHPGDLVLSRGETDPHGQNVLRRIEEVFVRRVQSLQILTIRSSCGAIQTLSTTQVHPVYINTRGWVDAAHIQVGDQILEPGGEFSTVTASCFENHPEGILVYNFRVAGTHTYFAREKGSTAKPLLVHNSYVEEAMAGELPQDLAPEGTTTKEGRSTAVYPGSEEKGLYGVGMTEEGTPNFAGTDYLYQVRNGQRNIVQIKLSGRYGTNETAANAAAGLAKTPAGYSWHHLDYDPVSGMGTVQLVETWAHVSTYPHTGGAGQFRAYNGWGYR